MSECNTKYVYQLVHGIYPDNRWVEQSRIVASDGKTLWL